MTSDPGSDWTEVGFTGTHGGSEGLGPTGSDLSEPEKCPLKGTPLFSL